MSEQEPAAEAESTADVPAAEMDEPAEGKATWRWAAQCAAAEVGFSDTPCGFVFSCL
eukprot:SAG22_NODE_7033_length_783_cov_2.333333_1_plen_57_part_00